MEQNKDNYEEELTVVGRERARNQPHIIIDRPAYTRDNFNKAFNITDPAIVPINTKAKQYIQSWFTFSADCAKKSLLKHIPCIALLYTYQWKKWLLADLVAGLSVGVIHIPQGMGFALLANVPAVYGLYTSIFPLWVYFILGTSRHLSLGTMALISLMIGTVVNQEADAWTLNQSNFSNGTATSATTTSPKMDDDSELITFKVGIALSVTVLMGVFQLVMWICKLGILASYMSMSFISAFMTGAACHIITSQVPALLGLQIEKMAGTFSLPKTYVEVFKNIAETNIAALVIGTLCVVFLVVLKQLSDRTKKVVTVPIPAELIVVIVFTITAHFGEFNKRFNVNVIGYVPRGLPPPTLPTMHNYPSYIVDSIVLAIIGFAISISMAKMISNRHHQDIDTNQELMAYGFTNVIGSFFHSFGGAQAPPRTLVCEATGGRTQLAGLISTILPLLVCLALGPLFESLPICILSAIIIVALLPLMKTFAEVPHMWHVNKIDLAVYLITVLCVVFFSIVIGLVAGIGSNLFLVVAQMQFAKGKCVVAVENTEIYVPVEWQKLKSSEKVMVFRPASSLFFANIETFKEILFEKTAFLPCTNTESLEGEMNLGLDLTTEDSEVQNSETMSDDYRLPDTIRNKDANKECRHCPSRAIVLDCSAVYYIDIMGLTALQQLKRDYEKGNVIFALAGCNDSVIHKLKAIELLSEDPENETINIMIFHSVIDAVKVLNCMIEVAEV